MNDMEEGGREDVEDCVLGCRWCECERTRRENADWKPEKKPVIVASADGGGGQGTMTSNLWPLLCSKSRE